MILFDPDSMPTAAKIAESLQHSQDGQITAFELAFGLPFFEHKKQNPEKNAIFAKLMAGTKIQNRGQEMVDCFDWERFSGTLVDVDSISNLRYISNANSI